MSDNPETPAQKRARLRWVTLGEAIAIAALILSGIGLWHEFNKREEAKVIIEKPTAIALALRGRAQDEGRTLEIAPAEDSHALQSLTISANGSTVELGSDGLLDADDAENLLGKAATEVKGTQRLPVRVVARYVEAGTDKTATGSYSLAYRWQGGGLLGGRSLRLVGLSR